MSHPFYLSSEIEDWNRSRGLLSEEGTNMSRVTNREARRSSSWIWVGGHKVILEMRQEIRKGLRGFDSGVFPC